MLLQLPGAWQVAAFYLRRGRERVKAYATWILAVPRSSQECDSGSMGKKEPLLATSCCEVA